MPYHAHNQFIAPARARSEFWRLIVGLGLCTALYMGLLLMVGGLVQNTILADHLAALLGDEGFTFAPGSPAARYVTLYFLGSFMFLAAAPLITVRLLHKRSPLSLIGPLFAAGDSFWRVLKLLIILNAVLLLLPPYFLPDLITNVPLTTWILWLPISLLLILMQTGAEELLFRGYIQQQLAARFKSPLIWMTVPAALFALGHYDPGENGENALIVVAWAGLFSLLASDLTARSGNLGAAIGMHFATNIMSILLISFNGPLGGLALYHLPFDTSELARSDPLILIDFALIMISWLACRIAIRR